MSSVYERRVEQEWQILDKLAAANPDLLIVKDRYLEAGNQILEFALPQTPATILDGDLVQIRYRHSVRVQFPGFFPALPLEVSVIPPVFHPNVHPDNGFVCLWDKFSARDTIIEATVKLQTLLAWGLLNRQSEHLMQPKSLEWLDNPYRAISLPLDFQAIRKPMEFETSWYHRGAARGYRQRLS